MKVFIVNPKGYGNLSSYDSSLISELKGVDSVYYTNVKFESSKIKCPTYQIFRYSDKKLISKGISYLKSQISLYNYTIKFKPKIIHFQWFKIPHIDYYFSFFLKRRGIKIVHTVHNILPHDSGLKYFRIYQKIYRFVDALIVHSELTKKELESKFGIEADKIHVIPHGILRMERTNQSNVDLVKSEFEEEYQLKDKVVFSLLGSINKYKGVGLVIDAWQNAEINNTSDKHLIIAGNGKFDELEKLSSSKNSTVLNRFLSDDEFVALVQLSDYVLLPYLQISQSGVLFTVLNEKTKIIVSKRGGLPEPFQFGKIGYILKELDSINLAETILEASKESDYAPKEKIWEDINEFYSWNSIGLKTSDLYHKILQSKD